MRKSEPTFSLLFFYFSSFFLFGGAERLKCYVLTLFCICFGLHAKLSTGLRLMLIWLLHQRLNTEHNKNVPAAVKHLLVIRQKILTVDALEINTRKKEQWSPHNKRVHTRARTLYSLMLLKFSAKVKIGKLKGEIPQKGNIIM